VGAFLEVLLVPSLCDNVKFVYVVTSSKSICIYTKQICSKLSGQLSKLWLQDFWLNMEKCKLWAVRSVVLIPGGAKDFSLVRNLQTCSGVHPASYARFTGVFPAGNAVGAWR